MAVLEHTGWRLGRCAGLKPAGSLRFNYYDQIVRAALAGQGVALGRLPLVQDLLQDGSLVVPFGSAGCHRPRLLGGASRVSARGRPEVERFVQWISTEARRPPVRPRLWTPWKPSNSAVPKTGTAAGRTRVRPD